MNQDKKKAPAGEGRELESNTARTDELKDWEKLCKLQGEVIDDLGKKIESLRQERIELKCKVIAMESKNRGQAAAILSTVSVFFSLLSIGLTIARWIG